jgi:hypothetical protein
VGEKSVIEVEPETMAEGYMMVAEPVVGSHRIEAGCMTTVVKDLHTLDAEKRSAVEVVEIAEGTAPIVEGSVVATVAVAVPMVVVADMEARVVDIALEAVAMVMAVDTYFLPPYVTIK